MIDRKRNLFVAIISLAFLATAPFPWVQKQTQSHTVVSESLLLGTVIVLISINSSQDPGPLIPLTFIFLASFLFSAVAFVVANIGDRLGARRDWLLIGWLVTFVVLLYVGPPAPPLVLS